MLPDADGGAAMAVAERLRRSVRDHFADHPGRGLGLGRRRDDRRRAAAPRAPLMRAANRALYAAKHLGRDRCVAYHAQTLEMLDAVREADGAAREQLAAAMLLAETLDLRDVGTARHSETVGRYAEQIARALGWDVAARRAVRAAGILHDIGKLGISDAILHKAGAARAARVGRDAPPPRAGRADPRAREPARHRRLGARPPRAGRRRRLPARAGRGRDPGRGAHPRGRRRLRGDDRRPALSARAAGAEARAELERGAGAQFDARVVDAFLGVLAAEGGSLRVT